MTPPWQLVLTWGVVSGIGSGCITIVLSATIVNRWFVTNRGLVMGLFAASTSTGTLIFIPALSAIAEDARLEAGGDVRRRGHGAADPAGVLFCCRNGRPISAKNLSARMPNSSCRTSASANANPLKTAFGALGEGVKNRDFWLLSATFFVCGFTTNGLVGTHMIALCHDHGLDAVAAGGLLAIMGLFDLVGTTASGWLTDRIDPAQAAVRLLRPARAVADLSALRQFHLFRPVAVRGVLWPGLDRHRAADPGHRQPGLRHQKGPDPVRLDFGQPPGRAPRRPPFSPAPRAPPRPGSYLDSFVIAGFVAVGAAFLALDDRQERRPNRPLAAA